MADEREMPGEWGVVGGGDALYEGTFVEVGFRIPGLPPTHLILVADTEGVAEALADRIVEALNRRPDATLRIEDPERHQLAREIREARKAAGMHEGAEGPTLSARLGEALGDRSIKWLADELVDEGADTAGYSSVYRYVKGQVEPSLTWLRRAAAVLGVPLARLVGAGEPRATVHRMTGGFVAVDLWGRIIVLPPSVVEEIRGELEPAPTGLEARIERSLAWYRGEDSDDGTRCPVCGESAVKMVNWCVPCGWRPLSHHTLHELGRAEWDEERHEWRLVEPEGEG